MFNLTIIGAKIAFLAVLYTFLIVVVAAIFRDLRRPTVASPANLPALLEIIGGVPELTGREFILGAEATVGREPEHAVYLSDSSVSASHARIFRRDGTYFLEDLGSTNGTMLNGARISAPSSLKHRDKIKVGRIILQFKREGQ